MSSTCSSYSHSEPTAAALSACRVCGRHELAVFAVLDAKTYWRCASCQATLLADAHLPTLDTEHARYMQHRNDPADGGYLEFLNKLAAPLVQRLSQAKVGLDYGCGPGPALAQMLTAAGHRMYLYDPIFAPSANALERTYDFITCTETVEHFHHPHEEFRRLDRLLLVGGWLAIMTNFQTNDEQFEHWHYRRDPTHVNFYREATFARIAADFGWQCEIPARNVVLMQKSK